MFRELNLHPVYTSDEDNIARDFYIPVLRNAQTFNRTSAYFSARALAAYSEGLEYFSIHGQKYRLIISKDITEYDFKQLKAGYALRKKILDNMVGDFMESLTIAEEKNISNLAYFIAKGVVDIKIAFKEKGIFHDKCGIITDEKGDKICFRGSNNETEAAINANYESFQVTCSWLDPTGFYTEGIVKSEEEFEHLWNNKKDNIVVLPVEDVIIKEIMKYNKGRIIVEEILLKRDIAILDIEGGQLLLHLNMESTDWLLSKTFFKSRLKHRVEKVENNIIYFKTDLSYPEYIKIDSVLKKRIPQCGFEYTMTQRLKDFIDEKNLHIKERSMLGTELKTDNHRLEDRYKKFKSIVDENMERTLRDKQMRDAFFMYAMTKSGNFSVPGSGKTSSALAVYCYLKECNLVDRIVMIGPKNAFGSWIDEFQACFGDKLILNCFNIQNPEYKSVKLKKNALRYESADKNLFLINYEGLGTCLEEIKHIVSNRTLLIFDEVHKVKAINGKRATDALAIAKCSSYTIAMTGTPIPNTYMDLYNLLHILYNDEYMDFFGFDIPTLKDPSVEEIETINERIQPFFCRTTKQELNVPEANPDIINKVNATKDEQELFEIVCKKYQNNKLALFIRILQLESNPKMILKALDFSDFKDILDITDDIDDIDMVDYSNDVKALIDKIKITSKTAACIDTTKELVYSGKKVVIWCIFRDSIKRIKKLLENENIHAEYIMGEVELEKRQMLIADFRNGKFDVLITNPHTLAESVSLHSVCHDAIYFEYSYNLVHLLQSKDRIHRLGLKEEQYTQYYFMESQYNTPSGEQSIDNKVYLRLKEKEQTMLDAIDNHELEPVYTPEEDLELIFNHL
jgi:SNF2 family DNA or RNA helicase